MRPRRWLRWTALALGALFIAAALVLVLSPRAEFVVGGAMINVGYRLQDHLERFDLQHEHARPAEVWNEFLRQNQLASSVRARFPRSTHHPAMALVLCMDARLDTSEIVGDTRRYYYIVRTAGSVMSEQEEDMLELAVANGVRVIVLTTHTDCAAERMAANPEQRAHYPALAAAVGDRERRIQEFLARPGIASRIASGELEVRRVLIDTATGVAHEQGR